MPTGRSRFVVAPLVALTLVASACNSATTGSGAIGGAPSVDGAGADSGVDVPLPTIGLGSDTGSSGGAVTDASGITRAVMIGDSITVGATPFLIERFGTVGLPVEIGAQEGKRIDVSWGSNPAGTRVAEQFVAGGVGTAGDAVWIVALGTNDIGQYAAQGEVEQEIRDLLAFVPSDAPLVWINTWFRDRPDATTMVNAAIESVMRERGNATIGDWSSVAPIEGVLRSDGVHPNDDGAAVFADLVVGTVRDFLQA
ncbi:MAG: GDSL-type esterase/lipase family protein [Actinomycetota bacterium]